MLNIVLEEPYEFIPPVYSWWWPRLLQYTVPGHLRRAYGVTSVETRGTERLRAALDAGQSVLLAPNHCRLSDPLTFGEVARKIGRYPHAMASWHLFKQSRMNHFMLRRVGAFSVYREGVDRRALDTAIDILTDGRRPLIVFAEGAISRHNDILMPMMDGPAFIARNAAKRREKQGRDAGVAIFPVAIRYFFQGDVEATVLPVLDKIESHFAWYPQHDKPLVERLRQIGQALLSLKEIEYLGEARTGDFYERVDYLIDQLLARLEAQWGLKDRGEGVVARVKAIRVAVVPHLIDDKLRDAEKRELRKQLAACYYLQQMSHYPRDYVRRSQPNILEHVLETVERFEEDFTDQARPHPPLHAVLQVGEAIPVGSRRERAATGDPIMDAVRDQLASLLGALAAEARRIS